MRELEDFCKDNHITLTTVHSRYVKVFRENDIDRIFRSSGLTDAEFVHDVIFGIKKLLDE